MKLLSFFRSSRSFHNRFAQTPRPIVPWQRWPFQPRPISPANAFRAKMLVIATRSESSFAQDASSDLFDEAYLLNKEEPEELPSQPIIQRAKSALSLETSEARKELLSCLDEFKEKQLIPPFWIYKRLIFTYFMDQPEKAIPLVREMFSQKIIPDANSLYAIYALPNQDPTEFVALLHSINFDCVSIFTLLETCIKKKDWIRAEQIIMSLKSFHVKPPIKLLDTFLETCMDWNHGSFFKISNWMDMHNLYSMRTHEIVQAYLLNKKQFEMLHSHWEKIKSRGEINQTLCGNMFSAAQSIEEMIQLSEEIPQMGFHPPKIYYVRLFQSGDPKFISEAFRQMRQFHIKPDRYLYNSILKSHLLRESPHNYVDKLLAQMEAEGVSPNSSTYKLRLDHFLVVQTTKEEVAKFLSFMKEKKVPLDTELANAQLAVIAKYYTEEELLSYFEEIKPQVKFDEYSYLILLSKLSPHLVERYFLQMLKERIKPTQEIFSILFQSLKKRPPKFLHYFQMMISQGLIPNKNLRKLSTLMAKQERRFDTILARKQESKEDLQRDNPSP